MSSTLNAVINAVRSVEVSSSKKKTGIADALLGKYRGVIPGDKSSTEFIRELREGLYGKIK